MAGAGSPRTTRVTRPVRRSRRGVAGRTQEPRPGRLAALRLRPTPVPGEHDLWSTCAVLSTSSSCRPGRRRPRGGRRFGRCRPLRQGREVSVDGQPTSVHVLGSTVADVLDKQDIAVGPHDVVVPSLASSVDDGDHISVRYGRKLTVTVDGQTKEYWTTATTVDSALQRPRHPCRRCRALRLALPAARPRRSQPSR